MFNPLAATTIGALEQTISFSERRHELLAGNVANLSTPDYRSRDLDVGEFQKSLAQSIKGGPSSASRSEDSLPSIMPGIPAGMLGHPYLSADAMNSAADLADADDPRMDRIGPKQAVTRDDQWAGPRTAMEQVVYHDNSDVSLEQQVNLISKNKHMHNLAITTLRNQFELLRAAITERA